MGANKKEEKKVMSAVEKEQAYLSDEDLQGLNSNKGLIKLLKSKDLHIKK